MEDLLYLVHRIPFPPNKGDKIRSYNILKYLSQHYRVHLGCFVDAEEDLQYVSALDEFVASKKVVEINPAIRKILSLRGILTGEALTNAFYRSTEMQRWVNDTIKQSGLRKAIAFSSPMATFLLNAPEANLHCLMDFVDVDSEKWFQYAENHRFPMSLVYQREGNKLRSFERLVCHRFDACTLVSDLEADLFRKIVPDCTDKVTAVLNGVDTVFFDPAVEYATVIGQDKQSIVFTGAMDYWANVEAVTWFVKKVLPIIQQKCPDAVFYIVGTRPAEAVKSLSASKGVIVTGAVKDVRPYIANAKVLVAPLRIARGIQNKVLEALAMNKYIVATPQAMEGIADKHTDIARITQEPESFAEFVISGFDNTETAAGRDYVLQNFSWNSHLSKINELI